MSSTALALQLLAERGQLNSQFGRSAFSILLFQDVSVMPALALLPLLGVAEKSGVPGGWLVIKLIAVLATVIIGGRYVLRPMLRIIAASRVAEAFTAAGLLIVVGNGAARQPSRPVAVPGRFLGRRVAGRQRISTRTRGGY